ncbi:integration host factor, actinobacterial type [Nocardia sp. NPDC052566]|uniref:integration host factor, actinobacterial type n=1 Tax=Nocardia sp. NPDC052566 TaxID=3364330 RepID=UPI0037CB2AB9
MAAPILTDEQRSAALAKATEVRRLRADLKRQLKTGAITFEQGLQNPDIAGIRVVQFLQSLPRVSKKRAKGIMADLGIPENRKVQGLGSRQLDELARLFSTSAA